MNSFYSILSVPIRPEAKELLSVGLLMRDEKQVFFHYSSHKLGVLKELLSKDAYGLVKLSIQSIKRSIFEDEEYINKIDKTLFPHQGIVANIVSESAVNYMSRYNKNLIAFSEPNFFRVKLTQELFNNLFKKLVDENEFISKSSNEEFDIVLRTREQLFPKIKSRVNTDFNITNKLFKTLVLPSIKVDFIGKNGEYVTGQTINFTKKENFLEFDVSKQFTLIDAIRAENGGSKCFILGKEPDKKEFPIQHQLWKNVFDHKVLSFVDADEFEEVAQYVENKDVKPLFL